MAEIWILTAFCSLSIEDYYFLVAVHSCDVVGYDNFLIMCDAARTEWA
jgi:hypothetical protein